MFAPAFTAPSALPALRAGAASRAVCVRRVAPAMSLRRRAAGVAAAAPAALAALPALAEGTGEAFGVDNALLLIPFILVPGVFLFLFLQFDRTQDKSDFFGGLDERRK